MASVYVPSNQPLVTPEFIIDELKCLNYEVRLNCIERLDAAALAVGGDLFREYIDDIFPSIIDKPLNKSPSLKESVSDDDSLTATLVEKLPGVLPYIGGIPYVIFLVEKLEGLLMSLNEEIRTRAVASVNFLLKYFTYKQMFMVYIPILKKLYESNIVSAKLSCLEMVVNFYRRSNPFIRIILRGMVSEMVKDRNPLIRERLCEVVRDLVKIVPRNSVYNEILALYLKLSGDQEVRVRAASLDILPKLVSRLTLQHKKLFVLPVLEAALADDSQLIRKTTIVNFTELFSNFREPAIRFSLMQKYVLLMKDCQLEVVNKTIISLEGLVNGLLPSEKFEMCNELIKPHIIDLVTEKFPDPDTIVVLASTSCLVASELSEQIIITEMLPIFKILFKSECHRVRASTVNSLHLFNHVLSKESLQEHLVKPLKLLSEDSKWIVRLASVQWHSHLALIMGFDYFETNLAQLFMNFMSDPVSAVREASVQHLEKLVKTFGYQSQISFVPIVVSHIKSLHYLIRIACVSLLSILIPICTKDIVIELILPTLVKSATDPVPNVRFKTAKAFIKIIPELDLRFIELFVRPSLGDLMEDKDDDVRFFANEALETIKEYFKEEEE